MTTIKRISNLIENSGRSASSIFKELKMPHNALTEWTKGKAKPSTEALSKIADRFDTSVDYLLVRTDETTPYPPSELLKKEKSDENIEAATDNVEPMPESDTAANTISNMKTSNTKAPFPNLLELPADFTPADAIPYSPIQYGIPIVGVVRAGIGGAAHEDIKGYETVSKFDLNGHEPSEYFWLRVKGDSMEPELYEDDLVLVHKQASVDSGTLAVILVDDIADSEGLVKKVNYGHDWIELVSYNEAYPPRRFEKQEVLRIYVVGQVVQSKRIY